MAAYSLDLRKRVLRAWDRGMKVDAVAATFDVSVAWVYRLVQRRRETGVAGDDLREPRRHRRQIDDAVFVRSGAHTRLAVQRIDADSRVRQHRIRLIHNQQPERRLRRFGRGGWQANGGYQEESGKGVCESHVLIDGGSRDSMLRGR